MPKTTVKENFKELVSRLDDYILEQDWPDSEDGREDFVSLACNLFEEIEFPDVEQLEFDLQAVDKLSPEYLQRVEELQQAEKTARDVVYLKLKGIMTPIKNSNTDAGAGPPVRPIENLTGNRG